MKLSILSGGLQSSVQDRGRFGSRKFGVTAGGALDSAALRLCQLLVGNDESAAGIEIGGGRFTFRCENERLLAWQGGNVVATIAGEEIPARRTIRLIPNETVEIRASRPGRAWLALSGGIDVDVVLGSRSTDLAGGFGGANGRFLRDGDVLKLGTETIATKELRGQITQRQSDWSAPLFPLRKERLRVVPGKDWTDEAGSEMQRATFRVSVQSDRMGLRLEGHALSVGTGAGEQVSAPVAPGTVQVPPHGAPIILLADCQTIGGYPQIAHLASVDLADAAQLQPQDEVRLFCVALEDARGWLRKRERDIALFRSGLRARFGY